MCGATFWVKETARAVCGGTLYLTEGANDAGASAGGGRASCGSSFGQEGGVGCANSSSHGGGAKAVRAKPAVMFTTPAKRGGISRVWFSMLHHRGGKSLRGLRWEENASCVDKISPEGDWSYVYCISRGERHKGNMAQYTASWVYSC